MRINRYLALAGYCTRREADKLIADGKVTINGRVAKLGDQAGENDRVICNLSPRNFTYLAYHKPAGEVTKERYQGKLFPLGRLDKDSRGILILTDDGRLTDQLLKPDHHIEKEYLVTVDKPLKEGVLRRFARGLRLPGASQKTKAAAVSQEADDQFRIILTEGKKHQIRRMCAAWGYTVTDLVRLRIGEVSLDNLKPGVTRSIKPEQLN